jgi:hypothetical protein
MSKKFKISQNKSLENQQWVSCDMQIGGQADSVKQEGKSCGVLHHVNW